MSIIETGINESMLLQLEGVSSVEVRNEWTPCSDVPLLYHLDIECAHYTAWAPDHFDYLKLIPMPGIRRVIFSKPCTIVLWEDGTKTIVRCEEKKFDKEKGLAMCISKKALGNKGKYYDTFKEWL